MVHFHNYEPGTFFEQQHGFHPRMSCVIHVIIYKMEHWTKSLDDGYDVDIIYLDYCKAFDYDPHQHLLSKLKACGISRNVLNWIMTFLSNRQQRVMLMVHVLIGAML